MERNDIGTDAATDDVSFDRSRTAGAGSAGTPADTEVSVSGTNGGVGTADASGTAGSPDSTGTPTSSTADGKLAAAKQKIGVAKDKVVDRMHATADWIREKDIESVKTGIEAQVRDHPGRTLLVAVGLGYLIGRAFRGGNSA